MLDFVFSHHGKINNIKLRPSDIKRRNQKKPRLNLDCFIIEKIMRQNVKTEENQPENITNLNNCQKSNSNNLTLDLSFEDLNNIIINKHLKLEKSSLKLNTEFNSDNNCSSINQNEINSTEQKNHFSPSINIDEESKSYIKEIIDNCKGKKGNYLIMDKNPKNNKLNYYIRTKPNININLKDINLRKENYKENGHIKRLKTEDLIEIAKRRKEHLNRKRNNKKDEDSFKTKEIKTEQNRKLIIDTEFNEDNCLSKKNRTNRINIKEEYFSFFLKSNKTQANLINNNINNIKKNFSINDRIKINNNTIKNHLFNLYKEKNKNYFNNQNNYEKSNHVKKLIQTKSGLNNTRKFTSIFSNDFTKIKKNNNLNRRNQITLKKEFLFNNQDSLNFLFKTNNSTEKVIAENNNCKKKGILNNNTNINSKSKKYNFFNYKLYNNNIKNKNILLNKFKNNSTNLINVLNKKSNSRFNNYNEKRNNLIIDSSSKNKPNNKSANYLSTNIQHNFKSKKDEKNVKNKSRPATIFHKLLNTDKGNQKDKRIYNTLISNEIYGRGFYKNSLQNKSENILNIKELKLKANSSVRVKKSDINNNNNNNNNYNFSTNNNVINSKYLKTSKILKFNKNIRTCKNISLQNNSINYLYQKKGVILNNKLFLNYSPIKMNNNDFSNYSKISLKNIRYKTSFNHKKMASNETNDDILSPKRGSENKENVQSLNIIKEVCDLKGKNAEINYIKKMDINNNNKNIFKKIVNEPNNYKELIHKKNMYKRINCNNIIYEKNKKILNKKFSYNNNTVNI